ncbi:hypothetical protein [Pseudoalteromonas sp. DL2-H2.2]|nr:hypothetical protein [Pseudoalteromonas sp. DL2-H2.2]
MLKYKTPQQYQLEMVAIEQLVSKGYLAHLIDLAIDFEFIHN